MRFPSIVGALAVALALSGSAAAEEATEAQRRAEAILKRVEEASQREFAPAFRRLALRHLAALPAEELRAREGRDPAAGLAPLAIGDSSSQLVYTPVPPCRLIDTRVVGAGGALTAGAVRDFRVTGGNLSSQGGSSSGCNVPTGLATSAIINFVAVAPAGAGNLRAWAYPQPTAPAASIINYAPISGVTLNVANGIAVPICDPAQSTCNNLDLRVRADTSATHLVADVVGYFERLAKEQIRSFSEFDGENVVTDINTSCTHVDSADVTVVAPVAGRVIVRAVVPHRITQASTGDRVLTLGIGTADNDCNFDNEMGTEIMNGSTGETFQVTIPVMGVFDVAAGTHEFFLNGFLNAGSGDAAVVPGVLVEATFHPN